MWDVSENFPLHFKLPYFIEGTGSVLNSCVMTLLHSTTRQSGHTIVQERVKTSLFHYGGTFTATT